MSSTNRGSKRIDKDEYQTPVWAVRKIVEEVDWNQRIRCHEPCLGEGNIFNNIPLPDDLKSYCDINRGVDYLKLKNIVGLNIILTNPPYSLALKFLEKSLGEAKTVIYLLRLNFLGSQKRHKFWSLNPPTHLFVLSKRPSFTEDGNTDSTEYAWFAWDRGSLIKKRPGVYVL